MKPVRTWHILSLAVALTLVVAACAPAATPMPTPAPTEAPTTVPTMEPTAAPQTIVDVAVADGRFTTLATALTEAGLIETLQGEGPFTVFAPTDEAFAALPAGTLEALLADTEQLTQVLLYHVVAGAVPSADVVNLSEAETVQGELVGIRTDMGSVYINEAQVVLPDVEASNGLIHVIDSVLLPPSLAGEAAGDIVEVAVADGRFATLATALTEAGLVETLQGEGPFTVFAPTDEAFAALPAGTLEALLADPEQLTQVLLYHVVAGEVPSSEVVNLSEAETVQGESVSIRTDMGNVYLNEAQVIVPDVAASNGVIHVIDSVLLPPSMAGEAGQDIVEVAVADGRFTTLATALTATGLVETLQGEGPFTVFAPTDEAFAALPAGTLEALLADPEQLTAILLYHVVAGEVPAADVVSLTEAQTVQGEPVQIRVANGKVFINEAEVIITDVEASNGIIHVIDSVILPPSAS